MINSVIGQSILYVMNKLSTEARCRIIWGDDPDSVRDYLRKEGISDKQAEEEIRSLLDERHSTIRENGIRELIISVVFLILLGLALYLLMLLVEEHPSNYYIRRTIAPLMGVAGLGFIWNLWKGTNALLKVLIPTKFKGNVGIKTD